MTDRLDLRGCPSCKKSVRASSLNCPNCGAMLNADPLAGYDPLEEELPQGLSFELTARGVRITCTVKDRFCEISIPRHRRKARFKLTSLPRKILAAALERPADAVRCTKLPGGRWEVTTGGQTFTGSDDVRKAIADLATLRCLSRGEHGYRVTRRAATIAARLHLRKGR